MAEKRWPKAAANLKNLTAFERHRVAVWYSSDSSRSRVRWRKTIDTLGWMLGGSGSPGIAQLFRRS
jgi:hypothetical protein